jgi:hypothetical protein
MQEQPWSLSWPHEGKSDPGAEDADGRKQDERAEQAQQWRGRPGVPG